MESKVIKKIIIIVVILIVILCVAILARQDSMDEERQVEYIEGMHNDVYRDGEYIVYEEDIVLKNNTNGDLYGYIIADIIRESEFVEEEFVYAYDVETEEKLLVFIPANSEIRLNSIHFKATSIQEGISIRTDRNPLTNVIFEKVNMK